MTRPGLENIIGDVRLAAGADIIVSNGAGLDDFIGDALQKAGVPAEMHLYPHGGHAFGLRRTKLAITEWPQLVETWVKTIGMIPN